MAPKASEKQWVCQHGCNQAYYLRKEGKGCPHLELLLKPTKKRKVLDVLFTDNLEKFERHAIKVITENGAYEEIQDLMLKLKKYKLNDKQRTIVIDKLCHNKTYSSIANSLGFSKEYVLAEYKRALKKLKEREYK